MEDGSHARERGVSADTELARQVHVRLSREIGRDRQCLADSHPAIAAGVRHVDGEGAVQPAGAVGVHHKVAVGAGRVVHDILNREPQEPQGGLQLGAGYGGGKGQLELVATRGHAARVQI